MEDSTFCRGFHIFLLEDSTNTNQQVKASLCGALVVFEAVNCTALNG